jgi:hypothetical protein
MSESENEEQVLDLSKMHSLFPPRFGDKLNERANEILNDSVPLIVDMRDYGDCELTAEDRDALLGEDFCAKYGKEIPDSDIASTITLKEPVTARISNISEEYKIVLEDADGVNHYWRIDGTYDGYCKAEDKHLQGEEPLSKPLSEILERGQK